MAIGMVIASHVVGWSRQRWSSHLGHVGVMLFFALSGYLITTRLLDEYRATGRISLRNFYVRRACRILPPAVLYLGAVWVLVMLGVLACDISAIRAALLFYINYANLSATAWSVWHFWSLSVEEHFYIIWPCLLILVGVRKGWRTAALGAVAICIWHVLDDHYQLLARLTGVPRFARAGLDGRTDQVADVLLWGCCLAFFLRDCPARVFSRQLSTGVAVITGLLLLFYAVPGGRLLLAALHLLPTVFLGAIVACPGAPLGVLLENALLRFVGRISYSLYLWQALFLGASGWRLPLPLALAAIGTCGYLSYRLVEQPFIRLGRSLTGNRAAG